MSRVLVTEDGAVRGGSVARSSGGGGDLHEEPRKVKRTKNPEKPIWSIWTCTNLHDLDPSSLPPPVPFQSQQRDPERKREGFKEKEG